MQKNWFYYTLTLYCTQEKHYLLALKGKKKNSNCARSSSDVYQKRKWTFGRYIFFCFSVFRIRWRNWQNRHRPAMIRCSWWWNRSCCPIRAAKKKKQIGKKNENSFQMPYQDVTALCLKSRSWGTSYFGDLKIAGCWVHYRRKFHEALEVIPKDLRKQSVLYLIMNQIRAIYREEGKLSGLSSDERTAHRLLHNKFRWSI